MYMNVQVNGGCTWNDNLWTGVSLQQNKAFKGGVLVKENTQIHGQKIGIGEKFAFSLGNAGGTIAFGAISSFIAFFYTDVAGISAAAVGTLLFLSRLFDGFSDIGMGIFIDKTKSRHGKARPWLLWMAIPSGIATALLFMVPDVGVTGKLIYAYITYNIAIGIIYTAITNPYQALISLITQDRQERSVLNISSSFMATIVTILIGMTTLPLVQALGGGSQGWRITFMILGALSTVFFLVCFFFTKERVKPSSDQPEHQVPVKEGFKALFRNKYWFILSLMVVFTFMNQGAILGTNVYYAKYLLGDANYIGVLTLATFLPVGLLMLVLAPIIKRIGKRNAAIAGSVVLIAGQLVTMVSPENISIVLAGTVLKGLGMGPLLGTLFAMLADTVEYGEWKSGIRTEGLVFSAAGLGTKIGTGLGTAVVGWVLAYGGYMGSADVQTASALNAIKFLSIYMPIGLAVIQIVILLFYKLDKEFPSILEDLHKRSA